MGHWKRRKRRRSLILARWEDCGQLVYGSGREYDRANCRGLRKQTWCVANPAWRNWACGFCSWRECPGSCGAAPSQTGHWIEALGPGRSACLAWFPFFGFFKRAGKTSDRKAGFRTRNGRKSAPELRRSRRRFLSWGISSWILPRHPSRSSCFSEWLLSVESPEVLQIPVYMSTLGSSIVFRPGTGGSCWL